MERIVVYEGDTAQSLAKDFCNKFSLDDDMEGKLVQLLDQQIAGVLPKIVEDSENQNESDSDINNMSLNETPDILKSSPQRRDRKQRNRQSLEARDSKPLNEQEEAAASPDAKEQQKQVGSDIKIDDGDL